MIENLQNTISIIEAERLFSHQLYTEEHKKRVALETQIEKFLEVFPELANFFEKDT